MRKNLKKLQQLIEKRPLLVFLFTLSLVIGVIALGNFIRIPKSEEIRQVPPKKVNLFQIGTTPTVKYQGQIEKSGVTTIVALAGGVVQRVNVQVGQKLAPGQNIVAIAQNYQGGNAASVARHIAQMQRDLTNATYDTQVEIINKQRELANTYSDNADKMREMASQAAADTQGVVNLNSEIIKTFEDSIDLLSADPASNSATILSTKQYLVQFKGTNAQLSASLRSAQYQASEDKPPAELASLQKDLTLKQLDLQQKSLEMGKELSELSLRVAQINEAAFYPATPFAGVVERVYVHPGQMMQPGTPLAVISGYKQNTDVIVLVPGTVAKQVSKLMPSIITYEGQTYKTLPAYISTEATNGNQYAITYHLTEIKEVKLTDKAFVSVELPLGNPDTVMTSTPSIPIDSVYQTEDSATVFVLREGKAVSIQVKLGSVFGDYVQIESGLGHGDKVILDRSVIDNQAIEE